jgi:hypothetical protein
MITLFTGLCLLKSSKEVAVVMKLVIGGKDWKLFTSKIIQ